MIRNCLAGRYAAVILSLAVGVSGAGSVCVLAGEADVDIFYSGEDQETAEVTVSADEEMEDIAAFISSESVGEALFTADEGTLNFSDEGTLDFSDEGTLDFSDGDTVETASAPVAAEATAFEAGDFVLMNIPYAKFYEAELGRADAVDAVSSSTLNKPRTGTLAGGSYHVDPAGTDISGVIYPVLVEDPAVLAGYTQITDESSVDITTTNRGQTSTTTYSGKDALFESADYSYYILSEAPVCYKVMHADGTFGAVSQEARTVEGVTGEITVGAHHADVEISLSGTEGIETGSSVSGIVLTTEDGSRYGLRHIANIWRATEIGWNLNDLDLAGKTITNIRYYTQTAVIDYPVSLTISSPAYVLMNIPYAKFYEAEIGQANAVDAVTSSTLSKPRAGNLAGGSYHVDPAGSDISGVIYPVLVKDISMLADYHQVTDADSLTITVSLRGQEVTTTYTGRDALFENPDYSYYVLSEKPERFKVMNENGSFSAVNGRAATVEGVTGTVNLGARHADIEIALAGTEGIAQGDPVSGIIVTTNDEKTYALRHIANIWRSTEIGWNQNDFDIQGKTITNIRYITRNNVINYPTDICVHKPEKIDALEATYEAAGNIEYYRCANCGKLFADEKATEELTEEAVVTPMLIRAPEKVTDLSTTVYTKRRQVRVTFAQAPEAEEYQLIFRKAQDEKWTRIELGGQTEYLVENLDENALYLFRVRGVKTVDGKKYYGLYSSVSRRWTCIADVSFKGNKQSITITFNPIEEGTHYRIRYASTKDMKDAVIVNISGSKSSYTLKGLARGTSYYIRVRAYTTGPDGKNYYGTLTGVKRVKTR